MRCLKKGKATKTGKFTKRVRLQVSFFTIYPNIIYKGKQN